MFVFACEACAIAGKNGIIR